MDLTKEYLSEKRKLFDRLYDDLNSKQREAVYSVNGPLLVLAGAGSGKTSVVVGKVKYLGEIREQIEKMPYLEFPKPKTEAEPIMYRHTEERE